MDWRLHVPLLNSPVILHQTAGVLIVSFLLQSLLISTIFIVEGNWAGVLKTLVIIGLVHLGLAAGALLVMILFFGNRVEMHFRLDGRGALSEVIEARANRAAQLAVLMGLASGSFGAAGAGVLAQTGARSFVAWKRVRRLAFDERRHTIYLMNSWHVMGALFCSPDNYSEASTWVQNHCPGK